MSVTAWAVRCNDLDGPDLLAQLKSRLVGEVELQKAACYRKPSDAMRFALGRSVLRTLIMATLPEQQTRPLVHWNDVTLDKKKNGTKPCLSRIAKPLFPHIADFNISHDGEWVLAAVASDGCVGIDVARVCCPGHMADIEFINEFSLQANYLHLHSQHRIMDFYRIWTAKEAYVKATGAGIASVDLRSISVRLWMTQENSLDMTVNGQPCVLEITSGSLDNGGYVYAVAKLVSTELSFSKVSIQHIQSLWQNTLIAKAR
ncbi:hypothetical protein H4217_004160 [Coemansia sp. RSA 1939]|nr:hypothetical protein H4217_004160 [Coemansia sp. RSA 1939]KAJ2693932.1 hypothetical protein GGH99_000923 [Coemansia sp. RSA 1285]